MLWLSRQLSEGVGDTTVLMVSHDAAFLDAVATDIIHFRLKQLTYYAGNYSAYVKVRVGVGVGGAAPRPTGLSGERRDGMGWDGMGWDGMDGTGHTGLSGERTRLNGVGWIGLDPTNKSAWRFGG